MAAIARPVALLAYAWLVGCRGAHETNAVDERVEPAVPETPPMASPPAPAAYVHSSERCSECHEAAATGWRGSAHARAATSTTFVRMRERGASTTDCAPCHAPLEAWAPAAIADEGVSCDACHAGNEIVDGHLALRLDDNVRYGPLEDAHDHYFHRMGASPLHASARFCGSCHDLAREVGGTTIPIYSELREWSEGPYAAEGVECQHCHMPARAGLVATGSAPRDAVSDHGFFGTRGDLRSRALEMRVRARGEGEHVSLVVSLRNRRAGHRVPSGMPGRRIVIRARVLDRAGTEVASAHHALGRVLVDADGQETTHHDAVRVASDERIAPRATLEIPMTLEAPRAGEIVVDLRWREMSDELAARLAITAPVEQPLAEMRLSLGPPARARHIGPARRTETR